MSIYIGMSCGSAMRHFWRTLVSRKRLGSVTLKNKQSTHTRSVLCLPTDIHSLFVIKHPKPCEDRAPHSPAL